MPWVSLRRLSHGCTLYGVSVATFGLGILASVIIWPYGVNAITFGLGLLGSDIIWLYHVWRQRKYLWPGSPCVDSIWLYSVQFQRNKYLWPGSPCVGYHMAFCMGASVITIGLRLLASVIIWQYSVCRERKYLGPRSPCIDYHVAVLCTASSQKIIPARP